MHTLFLFMFLMGCTEEKPPEDTFSPDTGALDTSDPDPIDTADTAVAEEDSDEEGRTGQVICASGGSVSNSNISGSFCFGAVDLSSSPTATSSNYIWHAGPMTAVSP